jgi:hypothetical protein
MTWKCLIVTAVSGIACLVVGYLVAALSLQFEVLIDYDSGSFRQRTWVGPILIRDESIRDTLFQAYPLPNGTEGITGNPTWRTAFIFKRGAMQSTNYIAGQVVNDFSRIAKWFPSMDKPTACQLKHDCLKALASGGESSLREFVETAESNLFLK